MVGSLDAWALWLDGRRHRRDADFHRTQSRLPVELLSGDRTGGWLVDAEWVATDNQQELRELACTALGILPQNDH